MLGRLVVALTALLTLTAAAVVAAYLLLFSAGADRIARLVPADASAYATVYLQPSSGQQMNLSAFIGRLPGFADDATLDDKIDQVVHNLVANLGVDYRAHLKPWLGEQAAVALIPTADGDASAVVAAVKDRPAAEGALPALLGDDGPAGPEPYGSSAVHVAPAGAYAFLAEHVVVSQSAAAIRAVIDAADGAASLADDASFVGAMDELPPDHLAAFFVDADALLAEPQPDGDGNLPRVAGVLVAEPDTIRVVARAPARLSAAAIGPPAPEGVAGGAEPVGLAGVLPADSAIAVDVIDPAGVLAAIEELATGTAFGQPLAEALSAARAAAALGLGVDLDALLDGGVALAVQGADGSAVRGQLLVRPSDASVASAALDAIGDLAQLAGGSSTTTTVDGFDVTAVIISGMPPFAHGHRDGTAVLALAEGDVASALRALESSATLSTSDRYTGTLEALDATGSIRAYGRVDGLPTLVPGGLSLPEDARDILDAIGGMGATIHLRENVIEFQAVLTLYAGGAE